MEQETAAAVSKQKEEYRFLLPGTRVLIDQDTGYGSIKGVAKRVKFDSLDAPRYKVGYWNGGEYLEAWFDASCVRLDGNSLRPGREVRIGIVATEMITPIERVHVT